MNPRHLTLALLLLAAWPMNLFSQNARMSRAHFTEKYGHFTNGDSTLGHQNYFAAMAEKMGLPDPSAMRLEQKTGGENGFEHYKYQQYHEGLPIVGSTYILHEKGGWVRKAGGHFTPNPDISATPNITLERALIAAQRKMGAKTYENSTSPELCFIDPAFPKKSERLRLAFQIDLTSTEPFDKKRFYVDAAHGKVIKQLPLIEKQGVPSKAATKYYGTVNITTDSVGPQDFLLIDPTRGISVSDVNGQIFTNNSRNWDLENDKQDEVALDAHYCTTRYYDMMLADFGWKGLDGIGKALKVQVHNNFAGGVNAFWDGEYTNYGDGNCLNGPLTTMEVVGHEFTHGMIDHTSKLFYDSESGAINESLADMFGKVLERAADPANFTWDLGHSFHLTAGLEPFRVMDDPKSIGMPAFYGGEFWDAQNDVHTNSSIGNLWFSMLVDGKTGTNEAGEAFSVPALGMGKASRIAFFSNKNYLTENSTYNDFYQYSLDAAEEVFGPGAPEIAAAKEAWKAVGLPASTANAPDLDLAVEGLWQDSYQYCGLGVNYPVTVEVANRGKNPYLPSMNGTVTLSNFSMNDDHTIALAQAILPGEVATFVVDNWFLPVEPEFFYIDIQLNLSDDEPNNNGSYAYISVVEHQSSDLDLYVDLQKPSCFSPEFEAVFYVSNESCTAVPVGTVLDFSIENSVGEVLWSASHALAEELAAFDYAFISVKPVLASSPLEELTCKLDFAADPNTDNNEYLTISPNVEAITGDYHNKFTNDTELENLLRYESILDPILVTYQNKSFVGSTGLTDDPSFFVPCPNFEDNFNNDDFYGGVNTTLQTCVDFSQYENSVLSFDMVQFMNNQAGANPNSSMLQVKWKGAESGKKIYFGQTEGQIVNHKIDLPKYFKGAVEIKFYTEIGQFNLEPFNFPTDDVVLIDNLKLTTNTVGTADISPTENITVSPNPARGFLDIRATAPLKTLELVGIDGKLLKRETVNGTTAKLELDGIENGLFFLRMETVSGEWAVRKVVKMD